MCFHKHRSNKIFPSHTFQIFPTKFSQLTFSKKMFKIFPTKFFPTDIFKTCHNFPKKISKTSSHFQKYSQFSQLRNVFSQLIFSKYSQHQNEWKSWRFPNFDSEQTLPVKTPPTLARPGRMVTCDVCSKMQSNTTNMREHKSRWHVIFVKQLNAHDQIEKTQKSITCGICERYKCTRLIWQSTNIHDM